MLVRCLGLIICTVFVRFKQIFIYYIAFYLRRFYPNRRNLVNCCISNPSIYKIYYEHIEINPDVYKLGL